MKRLLNLFPILMIVAVGFGAIERTSADETPINTLTSAELEEGWILLFDGETDFGWRAATECNWKVADGVISVSEGSIGLLHTTSQFGDFQLKVDFRSAPGTNSAVFLRTSPAPDDPVTQCYELNIADTGTSEFPTGSFVGRQAIETAHDSTEWQTYDVTAVGGQFVVRLDGEQIAEYTDPEPLGRGYIGLQYNTGKVEFRNIKLKPLGLNSLFNGTDLTGWKVYPDRRSEFTVTPEGYLRVENGDGQLESEAQFADFVLQLDVLTQGRRLNSGIFFRNVPGEFWQGYESQIQNGFRNGDRTKPMDCGTGGFYRRQDARRVVADDFEWFHKTLVVNDDHMATWVNGYQVSDWTDTRPVDANPRNGLRREAGTLAIQGHDRTTDILFRNLKASEIAPRH